MKTSLLEIITSLSHEFGTPRYAKAGGGNTSCKTADTLWVKPSGTSLAALTPGTFVAMDRAALAKLYDAEPPTEPAAREEFVKNLMAAAVKPEAPGRASVEAPLHDSLAARFVVHTHPVFVNGLTCAVGGRAAAARLFPEALWVPYIDPGYTLSMAVRTAVRAYQAERGREPELIFLENHGVFVSGDAPEDIRAAYQRVMETLEGVYRDAGIFDECWTEDDGPLWKDVDAAHGVLKGALGEEAAFVAAAAFEPIGAGPISPDHIVYAKSYPFTGDLTAENLLAFREVRGYAPRVALVDRMLLGVGKTDKAARLALELALDGAQVRKFAHAFGGIKYLDDRARGFIENWEVESYRAKQA